jgi:hypothetical protein
VGPQETTHLLAGGQCASDEGEMAACCKPGRGSCGRPDCSPLSSSYLEEVRASIDQAGSKRCWPQISRFGVSRGGAWPSISTAITTCLLTELSTVGSSHQKQFLRFAGAIALDKEI